MHNHLRRLNLSFPLIFTNQARTYEQGIYSSYSSITNQYIKNNLLFSRKKNEAILNVQIITDGKLKSTKEYEVDRGGVKFSLDFLV